MNIIGISGKKGHGKDTVALMLQYFVSGNDGHGDFLAYKKFREENPVETLTSLTAWTGGWEKKQFAGKLKQIVALLIGCKVEDLENNTFKNTPLEEKWDVYRDNWNDVTLTKKQYDNTPDKDKEDFVCIKMTPRLMLQLIGTEGLRDVISPDVHVLALFADYKLVKTERRYVKRAEGKLISFEIQGDYPKWVIPDTRFPNELEAIEEYGGVVIRVENPRIVATDEHFSETALDDWNFEHLIINDGTLDDLLIKTKLMLTKLKII